MIKKIIPLGLVLILSSCGLEPASNTEEEKINLKELTDIAPQKFIENPISDITPKSLPKYVDIIGKSVDVNVDLNDFKCIHKNNKYACIYTFNFLNGKGGRIHFSNVNLPENTEIHVFDNELEEIYTKEDGKNFWTVNFNSENVSVAYIYPDYLSFQTSPFTIDKVSYIWDKQLYFEEISPALARPTECEVVDLKCMTESLEEGKWKYAPSTVMIILSDNRYTYQCSGNLISSHKDKNDPILITARHCFFDNDELLKNAVFWFDYYNSKCNSWDGEGNRHYTMGGDVLTKYKNDTALVEIKGSIDIHKNRYTWIQWDENVKCPSTELVGFSYPKEHPLKFHEGFLKERCSINSGKKLKIECSKSHKGNGFRVLWDTGSVDGGSSGSALLGLCKLDNDDYEWTIMGILSGRHRGCSPADSIYADFLDFLKNSKEGKEILTQGLPEDKFEENDSFSKAFNTDKLFYYVCSGTKSLKKLTLKDNDDDWFSIYVPKGCELTVKTNYNKKYGNIKFEVLNENKKVLYRNDKDDKHFQYKADKNSKLFIHLSLIDDTYQNYDLILSKKKFAKAPHIEVKTNLGKPILKFWGLEQVYYIKSKKNVKLHIAADSDFYTKEDIKMCIGKLPYFCENWTNFKSEYTWNIDKEGKYTKYISIKVPNGAYSRFKKISIYYDVTPPQDGNLYAKKEKEYIKLYWRNFEDKISGIDYYRLVYGESKNVSCKNGDILYEGRNTIFFHKIKSTKPTYYVLCAKDKAGNWSKGAKIKVK